MKIELAALGPRELQALIVAAEKRLKVLSNRRAPIVVRRELTMLAASFGYTVEELMGTESAAPSPTKRRAKRKLGKVAAKYRDPDNTRNTWSGRGRAPRWLAEKVRRGQSATDFLIPGLAKPTAKKAAAIGKRSVYKAR